MADLENVIKALEKCAKGPLLRKADKYVVTLDIRFVNSILELLKEHEAVEPKYKERMGGFVAGLCPTCGTALNNILNVKACGKCGKKVKWDD